MWDTVIGVLQSPELLERELESLANPNSTTREALEAELAQMRDRLETLPREERRLMEGYRKGLYPDYMMREEMDRVSRERAAAEQSSRELETQLALPAPLITSGSTIIAKRDRLRSGVSQYLMSADDGQG